MKDSKELTGKMGFGGIHIIIGSEEKYSPSKTICVNIQML